MRRWSRIALFTVEHPDCEPRGRGQIIGGAEGGPPGRSAGIGEDVPMDGVEQAVAGKARHDDPQAGLEPTDRQRRKQK